DVRGDPGFLEGEEVSGPAAPHLDVVDDHQHVVLAAQFGETTQPLGAGGVDATLALDRLHDHRGGLVQTGPAVLQQAAQPQEVRGPTVEVVVEGHGRDVIERDTRAATL